VTVHHASLRFRWRRLAPMLLGARRPPTKCKSEAAKCHHKSRAPFALVASGLEVSLRVHAQRRSNLNSSKKPSTSSQNSLSSKLLLRVRRFSGWRIACRYMAQWIELSCIDLTVSEKNLPGDNINHVVAHDVATSWSGRLLEYALFRVGLRSKGNIWQQ
jgi:hypothetical protein